MGPVGVSLDLREYFEPPPGGVPIYKVGVDLGVLQASLAGPTLDISALTYASPGDVITVTVSAELESLEGLPLPPIIGVPVAILRTLNNCRYIYLQ